MTAVRTLQAAYADAQQRAQDDSNIDEADAASEAATAIGETLLATQAETTADLAAKLAVFEDLWLEPLLGATRFNDLFQSDACQAWEGLKQDAKRLAAS